MHAFISPSLSRSIYVFIHEGKRCSFFLYVLAHVFVVTGATLWIFVSILPLSVSISHKSIRDGVFLVVVVVEVLVVHMSYIFG